MTDSLDQLSQRLEQFALRRDWVQFHTPKNLAMALGGEVGELLAELQWLADGDLSKSAMDVAKREAIANECADVLIYLVRFADVAGIDLIQAANQKVDLNEARYSVDKAKGNAAKYNELG